MREVRAETTEAERPRNPAAMQDESRSNAGVKRLNPYRAQEQTKGSAIYMRSFCEK